MLNSILKRQLNGFGDDDPSRIESHLSGLSDRGKELFYLKEDLLENGHIEVRFRQGTMHVTTVQWHLSLTNNVGYQRNPSKNDLDQSGAWFEME